MFLNHLRTSQSLLFRSNVQFQQIPTSFSFRNKMTDDSKPEHFHTEESVWDYPRPPAIEKVNDRIEVIFNGVKIADTTNSYRILETSHPPTYYIPPSDILTDHIQLSDRSTFCEFKGKAGYYHIKVGSKEVKDSAWFYSNPTGKYSAIKDHVCFYASKMDTCYVDGEKVQPQKSDFYGGWITSWVNGGSKGMKGPKGTEFW